MRAIEFLRRAGEEEILPIRLAEEGGDNPYVNEIQTALTDLLAASKANDMAEISTELIVQQLNNMGYNVDINSIMDIVGGNPFVQVATKDAITLKGTDDAGVSGDATAAATNQEKVKDMAQKAAAKDMK